jgi:hypothetical protein
MRRTFGDSSSIELLAFDLMVASDVLAMAIDARRPEDFAEIGGALSRLAGRGWSYAEHARLGATVEGKLAHALSLLLQELHAVVVRLSDLPASGPDRRERASEVQKARLAVLEVARSAQSIRDFWRVEETAAHAARVAQLRVSLPALDPVLELCRQATTLCGILAARGTARWSAPLRRLLA